MADEAAIERRIIDRYNKSGWSARHVEPDGIWTPAGWPDVEALGPGGRIVFIEVKDPSDPNPDPIQVHYHTLLRNLGHEVIVATCVAEAEGPLLGRDDDEHTG